MDLLKTLSMIAIVLVVLKFVLNKVIDPKTHKNESFNTLVTQETTTQEAATQEAATQEAITQEATTQEATTQEDVPKDITQIATQQKNSLDMNTLLSEPVAPNNDVINYEKGADFSNDKTLMNSKDFQKFFNNERHNCYVPNTQEWGEKSNQMYQNKVNEGTKGLNPFNYDQNPENLNLFS